MRDDIQKAKRKGLLGESPTIKCLKTLKEFKKTVIETDEEKILFSIEDDILEEMVGVLGAEQRVLKRVRDEYYKMTKEILDGSAYKGRKTINKAEVKVLFRNVGKKMHNKLKFGKEDVDEKEIESFRAS